MDDDKIRDIVASLPEKPSRSRLEPYRQLIAELRRLGRTYREIAHILGEKCQLQVSAVAVHNFVRLHLRRKRNPAKREAPRSFERPQIRTPVVTEREANANIRKRSENPAVPDVEVRRRIEELKRRPVEVQEPPVLFHYNPDEPWHLRPKSEKK